jgi:hypothetical protein
MKDEAAETAALSADRSKAFAIFAVARAAWGRFL